MNSAFFAATRKQVTLPPGPRERFPGENLWALHRDPTGFMQRLARDHGDIANFRCGAHGAYLVNHPDLIKEVLVTQNRVFPIGIWQRQAWRLLGDGLVTTWGEQHLRHRRMVQPSFHHSRLEGLSRFTSEYTDAWTNGNDQGGWREGLWIETAEDFWKLTLKIVAQSLFSTNIADEFQELLDTMNAIVALASPAVIYFAGALMRLPLPMTRRFETARARLDKTIYRIIAEHRAGCDQEDLLAMLLNMRDEIGAGLNDEELRDETLTLLMAGHGTTAIALMWAFYLLSQNPDAERLLHEEIDTVLGARLPGIGDLGKLSFTRAVFAEALRLYPPAWVQDRQAARDVEIGGYLIPKGSIVLASQWVTHRDARFFPEPTRFLPERWLGTTNSFMERMPYPPRTTYFPFGIGPRVCVGEELGWMNGMLIMATIARRWRLELAPGHRVELLPRSGLGSKYGMRMVRRARTA